MLHLAKLSVGTRDIAGLRAWQVAHAAALPPLRHRTRNRPRRAAEIVDGGSIYWVIAGAMLVRQRIADIIEDCWEDGTACAGLLLHNELVPVAARAVKPFQGWRYLEPADAPADLGAGQEAIGEAALPEALRHELQLLCLL